MLFPNPTSQDEYAGWDQELYTTLESPDAQQAYRLAARLHHHLKRKDDSPYLSHINGSLQKLAEHSEQIGTKFEYALLQKIICLHDCAEDHEDGIAKIEKEFGIDTLIDILWMSIPRKLVRDGVHTLIQRKQQYTKKLRGFTDIYNIIQNGSPMYNSFHDEMRLMLPGEWYQKGKQHYQDAYDRVERDEEKRDVLAKYIFQGMVENKPEYLLLAKSLDRLHNLGDRKGLRNSRGSISYFSMVKTTLEVYCTRLEKLGYYEFAEVLRNESYAGVEDLKNFIQSSVQNSLE